jgi:hypothetical protein
MFEALEWQTVVQYVVFAYAFAEILFFVYFKLMVLRHNELRKSPDFLKEVIFHSITFLMFCMFPSQS